MRDDLRATDAYRYALPPELIATTPAEPRDAARLLVARRDGSVAHRRFSDFPLLLRSGDVLVVNETRVVRARLRGTREPGGGAAEVLLLHPLDRGRYDTAARNWLALVRPGQRLRRGRRIRFGDAGAATIEGTRAGGAREVSLDLRVPLDELMERHGELPLPPYVGAGDDARAARYQTVFARVPGSVAAPTASLHFTAETFAALRERDVTVAPLVLDVGFATFRPIATQSIDEHEMHAEHYVIPDETARAILQARAAGKRVVAAGTTVLRALESAAREDGTVEAGERETRLFITPGFRFRVVEALLTNFHLPASSLLVLVSAFAGYDAIRRLYEVAIAQRYRFYSFGDVTFLERADDVAPTARREA